ncbi:hypothetical protein BABINDRAFT_179232 [Babjeviella inositovora NRRL Y-12698]|uniref:Eukaryotic translation initiation factor 3 subunit A n=1 Tax=Babjeviella inositovora NRRL Y-12698 TaxID=984486 RepID=A0A1E3QV23_9ASCO|nr:uncharacterized protein BABINDRAFT_179232 [Babjeviella inositovora NRRL Y-12698]ODQ81521.1 hypothetical protein BABINDRAFT_179232 [Babjeviella inositovora NRRL Y-12698]
MAPYHNTVRPDNVLKRAEDLVAVGQTETALETLYELLTSKRTRGVAVASLEPIALMFVSLAVELRKTKIVKDGLHQYKKNVQVAATGLASVEVVCRHLLELAEKRLEQAQATADKSALDAEDDLEAVESPEDILLAAVSNEQSRDRSDREVVTPWMRFLWEGYRTVLDILRNNSKLEVGYAAAVNQAFGFAVRNSRKTEFRRLCEMLRMHIQTANLQQKGVQLNTIDLADPETIQRYLDLRFTQLTHAVRLELWQEAFRSVEDVHHLITLSKRQPKPHMMLTYYENLARIFLVSDNYLFHAAAWYRYYNLYTQHPHATTAELSRFATRFLLAALTIPAQETGDDAKNNKLAALLNLPKVPTRASLLAAAVSRELVEIAEPSIVQLYRVLESDFSPLTARKELAGSFATIEAHFPAYVQPLSAIVLSKLFTQVSKVYESVKLEYLIKLTAFEGAFALTAFEVELALVKIARDGALTLKIDHDSRVVTFVSEPYTESVEVPSLQSSPAELIKTQLARLTKTLMSSIAIIDPSVEVRAKEAEAAAITRAAANIQQERAALVQRREILEDRKRSTDKQKRERDAEAEKKRKEQALAEQKAEQERQEAETVRRAREKMEREKDAIRANEKKKLAEEINAKGIIKIDVEKLEELDSEKLRLMQVEQLAKDKNEMEEKLKSLAKRMDHIERAYRRYELPLLEQDKETQKETDFTTYQEMKTKIISKAKKEHEEAVVVRDRLARVVPDFTKFRVSIDIANKEKLAEAQRTAQIHLANAKQARIDEYKQQKLAELQAQQAIAQKAEADAAREEKLRQQAELQREREAEVERTLRERRAAASAPLRAPVPVAEAAPDLSKMSFAEKMKLKRAQSGR